MIGAPVATFLRLEDVLDMGRQIAQGVTHLHKVGVQLSRDPGPTLRKLFWVGRVGPALLLGITC